MKKQNSKGKEQPFRLKKQFKRIQRETIKKQRIKKYKGNRRAIF